MRPKSRAPLQMQVISALVQGHEYFRQTEHLYMVLVSITIGLLGGLGAIGFRECIRLFQLVAWRADPVTLEFVRTLPWWWKVLVPALGGLLVGMIITRFAAEAKGHGVPEVMESVALRGGRIRPRVVLAKLLASGICIASGGSVTVAVNYDDGTDAGQFSNPDDIEEGESRIRVEVSTDFTMITPVLRGLFPATTIRYVSARTIVAGARAHKPTEVP